MTPGLRLAAAGGSGANGDPAQPAHDLQYRDSYHAPGSKRDEGDRVPQGGVRSRLVGVVGLGLCIVGAVATWNKGPEFGPKWYPLALIATAMPCAWAGARLRAVQSRARPAL